MKNLISILIVILIVSTFPTFGQSDTMIVYDIASQTAEMIPVGPFDTILLTNFIPGNMGQMVNPEDLNLNFPSITPPNSTFSPFTITKNDYDLLKYPVRTNVAIVWYDSIYEQYATCSGTLIGSNIVLTAAHCIGTHNSNNIYIWKPDGMHVAPSFSNGFPQPEIGKIKVSKYIIYKNYFDLTINAEDIGLLILEEPIGNLIGWLGFGYNYDSIFYANNIFYHFSYPSHPEYEGKDMYYFYGNFYSIDIGNFRMENGGYGTYGMSGSSFFYTNNIENVIYGQILNPGTYGLIKRELYYSIVEMINQFEIDIVENPDNIKLINIYPNPIKHQFNVDIERSILNDNERLIFTLYNFFGNECLIIKNIKESNILVKRDKLKSGIYFYILESDFELIDSGKLIIN